jgi:hypothetical protein
MAGTGNGYAVVIESGVNRSERPQLVPYPGNIPVGGITECFGISRSVNDKYNDILRLIPEGSRMKKNAYKQAKNRCNLFHNINVFPDSGPAATV